MTKRKILIILAIIFIIAGSAGISLADVSIRHKIIQNSLVQQFIPAYHSLRKVSDLPFLVFAFRSTDLPEYRLQISSDNIARMNAPLPENPYGGAILESRNKVWVGADFGTGDYNGRVNIRYRGNLANHWNAYKKSYAVSFKDENLFNGLKELDLIIPYDRHYFVEAFNMFRAKRLGLLAQEPFFVRLNINGNDMGVYLAAERWSQEWIEKKEAPSNSLLLGVLNQKEVLVDVDPEASIYEHSGAALWKSWNGEPESFADITNVLAEIVSNATDKEFELLIPYILDMDAYYAWNITLLLTGHYHGGDGSASRSDNLVMLLDGATGKLRPIPYNAGIREPSDVEPSILTKRILSIPSFKKERDKRLKEYLDNEENIKAEEEFIDNWMKIMKKEFYSDNAKLHPSFKFISMVNEAKETIALNRKASKREFQKVYKVEKEFSGVSSFPKSYSYLKNLSLSEDEWLLKNPQFLNSSEGLVLKKGTHFFGNNVVVPRGGSLKIESGANIIMAENKSFLSFRPTEIIGTKSNPIVIKGVGRKSWGVFAVLQEDDGQSVIQNTIFMNGGESKIGQANFTGMLSVFGGGSIIDNNTFIGASGDDALNIKGSLAQISRNIFRGNSSDGIDVDYPNKDSFIKENSFFENNGDAIDLSFANLEVSGNAIVACGDKGISVGEASNPSIIGNDISGCNIGIAVKDKSVAEISGNLISDNRIGIAVYRKKPVFGGGQAVLSENQIIGNGTDFEKDEESEIKNAGE